MTSSVRIKEQIVSNISSVGILCFKARFNYVCINMYALIGVAGKCTFCYHMDVPQFLSLLVTVYERHCSQLVLTKHGNNV